MTRSLVLAAAVLAASSAHAQTAISGTFSATYTGTSDLGETTVALNLALQCSLTCGSSAPTMHYGVAGGANAHYLASPSDTLGSISFGFLSAVDLTGASSTDNTSFPPGSNFNVTATSVTCRCGNATGQGGYVDLTTNDVHIPPYIQPSNGPLTAGYQTFVAITASPVGSETLDVHITGAGVDFTKTYTSAEIGPNGSDTVVLPSITPTQVGTMTATASVSTGPVATRTFDVVASGSGTGGGSGAGGGDGSAAGGGDSSGGGCAAAPGGVVTALAMLFALRRRRRS